MVTDPVTDPVPALCLCRGVKSPPQPLCRLNTARSEQEHCSFSSEVAEHAGTARSSLPNILAQVPSVQFNLKWLQSSLFNLMCAWPLLCWFPCRRWLWHLSCKPCHTYRSAGSCSSVRVLLRWRGHSWGFSTVQLWGMPGDADVCCACVLPATLTFLRGEPWMLRRRQSLPITCQVLD